MKQEQLIHQKRLRLLLLSALVCLFAFMSAIALQGMFVFFFAAAFAFLAGHIFYACHVGAYEVAQIEAALMAAKIESRDETSQTVAGVAIETDTLFEDSKDVLFAVTGDDEDFIKQSLEASTYRRPRSSAPVNDRRYGRASGL